MATIKGLWRLHDSYDNRLYVGAITTHEVKFTNAYYGENRLYHSINVKNSAFVQFYYSLPDDATELEDIDCCLYRYILFDRSQTCYYWGGALTVAQRLLWRTLDFGDEEQEVSDECYQWITQNALKLQKKLDTPSVTLNDKILKITDESGLAKAFDIFADGKLLKTIGEIGTPPQQYTVEVTVQQGDVGFGNTFYVKDPDGNIVYETFFESYDVSVAKREISVSCREGAIIAWDDNNMGVAVRGVSGGVIKDSVNSVYVTGDGAVTFYVYMD